MKRQIFSLLLLFCILITLLTVTTVEVSAATSGIYTYQVSSNKATITKCATSASGAITIPSKLDNYPVTAIGSEAFANCSKITSVTMPDSITTIGSWAFGNCSGLTDIVLSANLTTLAEKAFYQCSALKSITIPNKVTKINPFTFYSCTNLSSVTLGSQIASIGSSAFEGCSNLKTVTIPQSVRNIGDSCFQDCTSLSQVSLGDGLYSIENEAFVNCENLSAIVIPNSVTTLGEYVFYGCTKLKSVTLSNNITSIPTYSFTLCSSLTDITIPDGVTTIGNSAFNGCSALKHITIPYTVKTIEKYAFYDCKTLETVTLYNTLKTIEKYAFYNCDKLKKIYFIGTNEEWNRISFGTPNLSLFNAAVWYPYDVMYHDNLGSESPDNQKNIGDATLSEETPVRLGHTFAGWATTPDATSAEYQPGDSVSSAGEPLHLYAVWTKSSYVTATKTSGGTIVATATNVPSNSQIVLVCYQGKKISYLEPQVTVTGQTNYTFSPNQSYDTAKVLVLSDLTRCQPLTEAASVQ